MAYLQITPAERYTLATLRKQVPALSNAAIARLMGRHRSTIAREIARNSTPYDGAYRPSRAQEQANGRRSRSRRNTRFSDADWQLVITLLRERLSPDQISGGLRLEGRLDIDLPVRTSRQEAGRAALQAAAASGEVAQAEQWSERRGILSGKRHISERPPIIETREEFGHWEMDTIVSSSDRHCVLTLVERTTGCVLLGKLPSRSAAATNRRVIGLIRRHRTLFKTITVDNGTEFHGYRDVERLPGRRSTSQRPTTPGNAARTRTRTVSFGSTSPSVAR